MIPVLAVTLLVMANALYVAAEFSSVSARRTRIAEKAAEGNAAARALLATLQDPVHLDNYIAACQIGITASSLGLGFYAQGDLAARLSALLVDWGLLGELVAATASTAIVLGFLTALQIIIGELVPKSIAIRHPERLALLTSYPMRISGRLFAPFIWLFNGSGTLMLRLIGLEGAPHQSHLHAPEEIELLIAESSQAGGLDSSSRSMLHRAFSLSGLVAKQVMIPRNRVALADVSTPADELLVELARSPYSRIPVYRDSPDNVLGIVHLKDLFRASESGRCATEDLVREVAMVPGTLPVGKLWQLLNQEQTYLAIVLGEHGEMAGIATQEDLLEEIIGEVHDEFDEEGQTIVRRAGAAPLVRGDVPVSDVNELLGTSLPTDRANTIGGLLVSELGRLAEKGDTANLAGVELRAAVVRERWIERVAVMSPKPRTHAQENQRG